MKSKKSSPKMKLEIGSHVLCPSNFVAPRKFFGKFNLKYIMKAEIVPPESVFFPKNLKT